MSKVILLIGWGLWYSCKLLLAIPFIIAFCVLSPMLYYLESRRRLFLITFSEYLELQLDSLKYFLEFNFPNII